jgi:hypothetical protein
MLHAQIVTFQLGSAAAAPGQTGLSVPVTMTVDGETEGGQPIAGLWVTVRYDPAALGMVSLENARETVFTEVRDQSLFVQPGMVGFTALYSSPAEPREEYLIRPGTSAVVANLKCCVLASAVPATYPLVFVDGLRDSGGDPFARTRAKTRFGDEYSARMEGGSVTVAGESVLEQSCPADEHRPPFPESPTGEFRLGKASGRPGGEVEVPFTLRADSESVAFHLSIDFDEEVLTATSFEKVFLLPNGTTDYDFVNIRFNNENEVPGSSGEGAVFGSIIFSLGLEPVFLPRNTDHEVLRFRFKIKEKAKPGLSELTFMDDNFLSVYTAPSYLAVEVNVMPSFLIINGRIDIIGDVTVFVRGDSNGDGLLDISDPQTTLGYLFLGSGGPRCLDACDVNDDGAVDITDAIAALEFLFLGGFPIPPPFDGPGLDRTEDSLEC